MFATVRIAKNIVNSLLAITLLIATTGVTLNKHYCMGRLKSVAINEQAQHCSEGAEDKMPCCKDVSEELKVEEITTIAFDFDANPHLYEVVVMNYILRNDFEITNNQEKFGFRNYTPPLPDLDIPIFIQSFLI